MSTTSDHHDHTTTEFDSDPEALVVLSASGTSESSRPPRRPRWLRTGAIVVGTATIVAVALAIVDLVTNDGASSSVRFDQQIERVELDVDGGDVEIVGTDEAIATVEITTHGGIRTPRHDEAVQDGVLSIDADCSLGPISPTCSIDYLVRTPRGVDIVARGSGTDYDLHDVTGDVDIALDGGDTDMQFAESPMLVRARTNGGDIDVAVPGDVPHRVAASSDGGSTHIDIATDPDSPYSIDAHANGGDITIGRSLASGKARP